MRRQFAAIALFALMSAACSSSTDALTDPEGTAEALQDCGLIGFLELLATFDRVGDIIGQVTEDDEPDSDITFAPTGTTNEFSFTGAFDTNADQANDVTLTGTALFSADPAEGFGLGDSVQINAEQTGTTFASYDLVATATLSGIAITGTATFPNAGGCAVNLTIPVGTPLNVISPDTIARLAGFDIGNFIEFQVTGAFQVSVTRDGITLTAGAALDGTNSVVFNNVSLNGIDLDDAFVLLPPSDDLTQATQCMASAFFTLAELGGLLGELAAALASGSPTVNGSTYSLAPVAGEANTFDVTIGLDSQTFTGRIVFPGDPTAGPITGLITLPTWALTAIVPAGRFGNFNVTSTAPYGVNVTNNEVSSVYGAATFSENDCTATVTISPNDPFEVLGNENTFSFSSTVRDATISGDALIRNDPFEVAFLNAIVNGLPVPSALVEELAEFLD